MLQDNASPDDPRPWLDDPDQYLAQYIEDHSSMLLNLSFMFKVPHHEREAVLQDAVIRALTTLRERPDHIRSFHGWFRNQLASTADHHYRRGTIEDPEPSPIDLPNAGTSPSGATTPPRVRREVTTAPSNLPPSTPDSGVEDEALSALRVERLLDLRCRLFAQCRNAVARLDLDSPDVKARRPAVNTERDRRIVAATTVAFFTRLEREDSIDHVYTSAEASPALAKKCLHDHARPHYADRPNSRDQFVDRNEADAYWAIGVVIRSTVSHEDTRLHDPADVHPEDDGSLRAVVRHGARRIVVVLGHSAVKLLVERLGGFITAREPTGRRRFVACHEWLDGLLAWLADAGDVHRFLAAVDAAAAWLAAAGTEHPSPLARARLEIEVEGERRAEARQLIAVDARLHDILGGSAA